MYKIGDEVSYGLHGKCVITGIETKQISSGSVIFYQIRSIKNPITARHHCRKEAHILIPVETAKLKGLRPLMTRAEAEMALKLVSDPDYHFELKEPWVSKQKQLEEVIRKEGAVGLAKVVGHLYFMTKRDAVPSSDVVRFYDNVYRIFVRELSDSLKIITKDIELLLAKALKNKLSSYN